MEARHRRIFYINSGNLLSASSNAFSASLHLEDTVKYDRIALLQINIPISYYIIQDGFNTFTLTENGVDATITVPAGNYNVNSFAVVVSALLDAASPNGLSYTVTTPAPYTQTDTGKFTYSVNSSSYTISITNSSNNFLYEQLGFNKGATSTFTNGSGSATLVSANVVKFVPEDTIFLHCSMVNEQGTVGFSDVLQEFYFHNNSVFGNQTWSNFTPMVLSKKINGAVKNPTFSITNEDGAPIFFNGLNINMTLMLFQSNDYYEKSLDYQRLSLATLEYIRETPEEEKEAPIPVTEDYFSHIPDPQGFVSATAEPGTEPEPRPVLSTVKDSDGQLKIVTKFVDPLQETKSNGISQ